MLDAYIGRQPIYDRDLNVFAYELLYRSGEQQNAAGVIDGNQATSSVILNSFLEIGLDRLVGNSPIFINLTREFITGEHPLPPANDNLYLEILEDIEPDDEVIQGVATLAKQGYQLALDDFVHNEKLEPLFEYVKLVKVELPELTKKQVEQHADILKKHDLQILAEKVETQEEFEFCKSLGFDYFQGYFLCKPNIVKGQRTPANRLATMRILSRLQDPNADVKELEILIAQDVTLSYKILRYINSAFFSLPKKVESIRQAVVYLGNKTIKHWATLIVMSGIDDKPLALMVTALIRAKMCELIAENMGIKDKESYSTAGLLSTLDALMDKPMDELLEQLPLSEEINQALLEKKGLIGDVLSCVIAYDEGNFENTEHLSLHPAELSECYLESVEWAAAVSRELAD